MVRGASAKRHAQAIFQIAKERDALEQWLNDLRTIAVVLHEPQVMTILENPKVRLDDKKDLVERLLGGINPLAKNLLYLLITRDRLGITEQILAEYEDLLNAERGLAQAEVTTAVPLDSQEQTKIAQALTDVWGQRVVITKKVDPDILGGLVAKIGDKVIDGSVRTRLQNLRRNLAEARS
ncbi:MAG: F0F1 ATP synthase subunit delta [Chloroflexi bacterium]|nr:F0F1 ATP synthase subunit delta [Chloroflexota bacterium]